MSGSALPRDRGSRRLAEIALARLLGACGAHAADDLVLVGGLVPEHLVHSVGEHQGTNDVDVLLDIGLAYDRDDLDYGWLEQALLDSGFVQANPNVGWRWVVEIEGDPVLVEFLVDVADSQDQEIALPGTTSLGAKNLRGPAPALRDNHVVVIGGSPVRMADLGGYLAAKAAAVYWRRADKDLYDFAFVLIDSIRADPGRAARAVSAVLDPMADRDRRAAVVAVCDLYESERSAGPETYARTARAAGSVDDHQTLALDAVLAIRIFRTEFDRIADD